MNSLAKILSLHLKSINSPAAEACASLQGQTRLHLVPAGNAVPRDDL